MQQTILGLDLGSYSIKGALFEATFRTFELTDLFESAPLKADELDDTEKEVVLREALLRLVEENGLKPSTVVTALSGMDVSSRILRLPLMERQIEKVLPFELEGHVPFGREELVVDYHPIKLSKNESIVLATAAQKEALAAQIALLKSVNLEPAIISLDSLALYNLHQLDAVHFPRNFAIVDIGHKKTSVCVVSEGTASYARTLFTAGATMTETIRDEMDLTWDQAVEVKHKHGIIELDMRPFKSGDLKKLSRTLRNSVDPIIREVLQTINSYRAQSTHFSEERLEIECIYLTGGGSLIRNLPEYIQSVLDIDVQRLPLFPKHHPMAAKLDDREPILTQAVGLGLRAAARGPKAKQVGRMNFRRDEFAFARDLSGVRNQILFFGKWVACVFALIFVFLMVEHQNLSNQRSEIETSIMKAFKQAAPDIQNPPKKSSAALTMLRQRINQSRDKLEVLTSGLTEVTALGLLLEISNRTPEDIPVDTQELSIERNKVNWRANTNSIASVDRIVASLQEYPLFNKVEKGPIRNAPNGLKTFQITVIVGAKDEEQGGRR